MTRNAWELPELQALTAEEPLLALGTLTLPQRRRLWNAMSRNLHTRDDPGFPVRVSGLGRGDHEHCISRNDLLPWARATVTVRLAQSVTRWVEQMAHRQTESEQMAGALRSHVALRRAWTLARLLATVLTILDDVGSSDCRWASLVPLVRLLHQHTTRWYAVATCGERPQAFASDELVLTNGDVVVNTSQYAALHSGSRTVFAVDVTHYPAFEASLRPALTWTPTQVQIARWDQSSESLARVASALLMRAGVPFACADATERAAVEGGSHREAWTVAALACWPSERTLAAAERAAGCVRLDRLARWAIHHIQASLASETTEYNGGAARRHRLGVRVTIDAPTIERALTKVQQVLRRA